MSNIQEAYSNRIYVIHQEIIDAKKRYEESIKNYLLSELDDREVIEFIGNNFLLSLLAIHSLESGNDEIGYNGFDDSEINLEIVGQKGIFFILKSCLNNISEDFEDELSLIEKAVDEFFDSVDIYDIYNMLGGIDIDKHTHVEFVLHDVDYHDEWTYSEVYMMNNDYKYFYERLRDTLRINAEHIVNGLVSGRYSGLYTMVMACDDGYVQDAQKKMSPEDMAKAIKFF